MSRSNRNKIFSGLALKYGITLKAGQNYISSNDEIIWDAINDDNFSNNIAGIGRDDKLNLYQKQSTSANKPNFLTIAVDEVKQTNEQNLGTISDQYFMLWGDNNKTMTESEFSSVDGIAVMERKWLMKVSGNKADDILTQVKVDASAFNKDSISSYLLVIDESGLFNFNYRNSRFVQPSSITKEGIITYDSVQWDIDGSGKDAFSFKLDDRPETNEELVLDSNSGIDEFNVYPGLSRDGNFKIFTKLNSTKEFRIRVADLSGKIISDRRFKNQYTYLIDGIPIESNGVYNITLVTKHEKVTKKIIIQK